METAYFRASKLIGEPSIHTRRRFFGAWGSVPDDTADAAMGVTADMNTKQ